MLSRFTKWLLLGALFFPTISHAEKLTQNSNSFPQHLNPEDLSEFASQPETVQILIRSSLTLASKEIRYLYGSADPRLGGLDCSGAVNYLLQQAGLRQVPRQANLFYTWLQEAGLIHNVPPSIDDPSDLDALSPGDLLFWTGTYPVDRDPPVTHVMIYLGKEKVTGRPLMVGAASSREGSGFGVFPFHTGPLGNRGRFMAYGRLSSLLQRSH